SSIREHSRLLRPYHQELAVEPFAGQQVVDAGDVPCNPFDIGAALASIEAAIGDLLDVGARVVTRGGDHTIALAALRAVARRSGPVALVHFDAHLDTWDSYFGVDYTHGTVFRRAAEEGLLARDRSVHVGIRGPLYARRDLEDDAGLGFQVLTCADIQRDGLGPAIEGVADRVAGLPIYVSVDIDVLDPAHAP